MAEMIGERERSVRWLAVCGGAAALAVFFGWIVWEAKRHPVDRIEESKFHYEGYSCQVRGDCS